MSREAYTPPTLPTSTAGTAASTQQTSGFHVTEGNTFEDAGRPVAYLCGECDTKVTLQRREAIRCKECGYRVLYKERTNRMIQFEAR